MKLKNNNSKVMAFQSYFILFVFIYIFFLVYWTKKIQNLFYKVEIYYYYFLNLIVWRGRDLNHFSDYKEENKQYQLS
jgi:hypothetical protein